MKQSVISMFVVCSLCGMLLIGCDKGPSEEQKKWALATTGILFERNADRHDILGGVPPTKSNIDETKELLSIGWGVYDRADLLDRLRGLQEIGHRARFEEMGRYVSTITDEQYDEMLASIEDEEERNQWQTVVGHLYWLGEKSLLG